MPANASLAVLIVASREPALIVLSFSGCFVFRPLAPLSVRPPKLLVLFRDSMTDGSRLDPLHVSLEEEDVEEEQA